MHKKIFLRAVCAYSILLLIAAAVFVTAAAGGEPVLSKGRTVYVPVYSHIVVGGGQGKREIPFSLSINLSVRNTDPKNAITVTIADYYDSEGNRIKSFLSTPLRLGPLASTYFLIGQSDTGGGWGANFLVVWESESQVNEPIIESVTYGSQGTHSISFINPGKAIQE